MTLAEISDGLGIPAGVLAFSHAPGTRVIFGPGELSRLGERAKTLGKRALIVSDPGISRAGYLRQASDSLQAAGLAVASWTDVHENPTTDDVEACVEAARAHSTDLLIGLGGGSSMDAAKGCNFLFTNGGEMKDYWGKDKASKPMLPLIAIPTTAGTGSECQSYALIADAKTHQKMACGDKKAAARLAILDPELTISQPGSVTAHTGIDAVTHALESLVTSARTETSLAYSKAAFALLRLGLVGLSHNPKDLVARSRMQVGAALAGTAIENSMLGAAHSTANPLTAHFGVIHGQAVGVMMPAVIRRNRAHVDSRRAYEALLPEPLDAWLEAQLLAFGMKSRLSDLGITKESLPTLAKEAAAQWTARFNPVVLSEDDFLALYQEVY